MNTESIQDGISMSFKTLIGLALLFPVITYFSNFINRKSMTSNMLLPVSSLEKYVSIWSAGILTSLLAVISSCFILSILWTSICTISYQMSLGEIYHAAFTSELFLYPLIYLMITAGFVVCIIGFHQKSRLKYTLPIFFILLIIGWVVLMDFLSSVWGEDAKNISLILMFVLGFFFSICFMVWGYFLFKKIQFINK